MNLGLTMRWGYSALQLNGNAYAYFPADQFKNLQAFTFEATILSTTQTGVILSNMTGVSSPFVFSITNGYLTCGVGLQNGQWSQLTSPTLLSLNEWHQVAFTFNGNNKLITLYQDGKEVASTKLQGELTQNLSRSTLIGVRRDFNGNLQDFFHGQIARIVIWKSARDLFQVVEDAVAITPPKDQTYNLGFWADFTEMPTEDRSGNSIPISYPDPKPNYLYSVPSVKLTENGVIDCGINPEYNFEGNKPYTIEGWMNPSATAEYSYILSFTKDLQWQYNIKYDKAKSRILASRNSDSQQIVSTEEITEGRFYHFAVTYNENSKMMSLYVNGNLQTAEHFPGGVAKLDQGKLFIGGSHFTGYFQNVRLWKTCLDQAELRQWMLNDVITDPRLVANFDFTVTPPLDTMGNPVQLLDGAAHALATTTIGVEERKAELGITMPINASYFNGVEEPALPHPVGVRFASQPALFSQTHKERTFTDLVSFLKLDEEKQTTFRETFEKAYAQAEKEFSANEKLQKVFTRVDENGRTSITYHSLRGDILFYDRPTGEVSDCTLWWISFTFKMTVGFFGIFLPLPTFSPFNQIPTKIFNLIIKNARLLAKITALVGTTIGVASALDIITETHRERILWPILKFSFISAGWFALTAAITRIITIITGTVAAEILAKFIVWAAQLTKLSLEYRESCAQLPENSAVTTV
ncbi:Concanavalin A-like lectin/glucanases superfamily protein [Chitinophaga sp. YR573]|uniref:LamG domain-containing protein n=1 Tax=Chitinophaga sp. YR573 TaxID=1881040 RepID=UPI0008BFDF3C|nr:LamG domain-containing protein [Chitinophaga sp. YR573]SEW40164.1 Concanavalin A-like lectin/glucanases superfamily protein [Chitinophaga sp. YR573]